MDGCLAGRQVENQVPPGHHRFSGGPIREAKRSNPGRPEPLSGHMFEPGFWSRKLDELLPARTYIRANPFCCSARGPWKIVQMEARGGMAISSLFPRRMQPRALLRDLLHQVSARDAHRRGEVHKAILRAFGLYKPVLEQHLQVKGRGAVVDMQCVRKLVGVHWPLAEELTDFRTGQNTPRSERRSSFADGRSPMRGNASQTGPPRAFLRLHRLGFFEFTWSYFGTLRHLHHNPIIKYGNLRH